MKRIVTLFILVMLSLGVIAQTRAKTGLTVGNHTKVGTNIFIMDSITKETATTLYRIYNGSTLQYPYGVVPYTGANTSLNLGSESMITTGSATIGAAVLTTLKVSTTTNAFTVDSVTTDGTDFKIYDGATQLYPDIPAAYEEDGIAAMDSTGNAPGNYMTQENYHTYASGSEVAKNLIAFGDTIKALPVLGSGIGAIIGQSLADTYMGMTLFYIEKTKVILGIIYSIETQGNYTPDGENGVALFKVSGTTYTQVAKGVDAADPNIWEQAAGVYKQAFSSPYTASPGFYFACVLYNNSAQTTAPKLYGYANAIAILNRDITGGKFPLCRIGSQAAFPANTTAAAVSAHNNQPYLVLY